MVRFLHILKKRLIGALMLTAIDKIANQNHLQMMKAIIPYLPLNTQKMISFYIKFMELQNIISFYSDTSGRLYSCSMENKTVNVAEMLNDISNYCDKSEKKMIDQISNLITTMELFSIMMENEESEDYYE